MEQFIDLLPTIIGAALIVGGGVFTLVRWLFGQEERSREKRQLERDKVAASQREAEEKIWARANETIDRLREEVKSLRQEVCDLREANKRLTKLLEGSEN